MEINASSQDRTKAATIANAVADAFFLEQVRSKYDATRTAAGWLNRQLDELKSRVLASDRAVQDFRAANNLQAAQGVTVNDQQISDLNNKLVQARVEAAEARAKYEQVQRLVEKRRRRRVACRGAVVRRHFAVARCSMRTWPRTRSILRAGCGAQNPMIEPVRAQLRETRRLIDEEVQRIHLGRRNVYEVAHGARAIAADEPGCIARHLDRIRAGPGPAA